MMYCKGCRHKLKPLWPKIFLLVFIYHLNMYLSLLWIKYSPFGWNMTWVEDNCKCLQITLNCAYAIRWFCLIYVYLVAMHSPIIDSYLHIMHPFSNASLLFQVVLRSTLRPVSLGALLLNQKRAVEPCSSLVTLATWWRRVPRLLTHSPSHSFWITWQRREVYPCSLLKYIFMFQRY